MGSVANEYQDQQAFCLGDEHYQWVVQNFIQLANLIYSRHRNAADRVL